MGNRAAFCAVLVSGVVAILSHGIHAQAFPPHAANLTNEEPAWAPLSPEHVALYFKRAPFSIRPHVEAFQDRQRRRLALVIEPSRRLSASGCLADLDKWKTKYETTLKQGLEDVKKILQVDKIDIPRVIRALPELGEKIRNFDFGQLGIAAVGGMFGVFGGLLLGEAVAIGEDVKRMVEKAREVIEVIRKTEVIVRDIGNDVLDLVEQSDFDHFISAATASASVVLNSSVDTSDKLFAVCRGFDYSQITQLSSSMDNFQLCTRVPDGNKLTKCQLGVGVAAVGALLESVTAAAVCDAHVAISQSHSAHPLVSLKGDIETFIQSLMATIHGGMNATDPKFQESEDLINEYGGNITAIMNEPAVVNDTRSADKFVEGVLADLHSRTLNSVAAVKAYTSSSLYKNMTALNPDAGAAGAIVGLALGKSQQVVMGKLGALQDKVVDQHNERMVLYDTINNTLWTNHAEFMGQVDHMGTLFTEQHTERMGRLKGVESSLGNIQSSTTSGFSQLRGRIQDMGSKFVAQVQGIEQNVVATGEQTASFLSNAVAEANRQVEDRINGVGDTVVRNHEKVMSAIGDAQNTAASEFSATQSLLFSASDSFRQTIEAGISLVGDTATTTFNTINDVVYKRMEESHSILDQIMAGMASDFELIDQRLVILENRAANMSKQLDVAKDFLLDIHLQFDQVQQMLDDLPAVVQQEMFQSDVDGLHRKYENMRKVYRDYLDSDLPVKIIAQSCASFQIYDLFLRFLRIIDVSDEEMPRQLDNFNYNSSAYEHFGITVIGVLNDLSFLDGVCAKAQFTATMKELEDKAKEQADMILQATAKLAHQVEEVIPALVLTNRIQLKIEQVSELAWDIAGPETVEKLRADFQQGLNGFALVTVMHAGNDGQLLVDHLDRDSGVSDGKPRHSGIVVSKNQKLAVMWSQTQIMPADKMAAANQTELLRQGVYRGNVTSTSPSCFVATSSDTVYPSCSKCSCVHYEDFASLTDPMAGRAVTYLADKTYDAGFVVETVFSSDVDYMLHVVQLNVGSLTPGAVADAIMQAPVISPTSKQTTTLTLWEGVSSIGRFDAIPSDIKGTVLSQNELTLPITHGAKLFRHTFSLFCDGYVKTTTLAESDLLLRYACSQVPRQTAPSDLVKQGYPYVASGLPTKRLDRAICTGSGTRNACRVTSSVEVSGGSAAAGQLTFGTELDSVTLLTDQGFRGAFAICRDCVPKTLEELTANYAFKAAFVGIPDAPAEMLSVECVETARADPEKLLVCRPVAAASP